jgi:hypothetical protein
MNKITEVNCETGEVIERELNADEMAQREKDLVNFKKAEEAQKAAADSKAALLAKLGITAEEAALLLG